MRPVFPGYPLPSMGGLSPGPNIDIRYFGLPNGGPSNPMPRPGSLGGNNGGGLASTVNSLPPQIESLSSALQNINELANQLTGGIGALMGSLQGNENAPGLGITDTMDRRPKLNFPPGFSLTHMGPQPMYQPAYNQGGIGALGQNPLQLGRLV